MHACMHACNETSYAIYLQTERKFKQRMGVTINIVNVQFRTD